MCDECFKVPCDYSCPNSAEVKAVYICEECGEEIYEGDLYFMVGNSAFCGNCVQERTASCYDIYDWDI